MEGQSNLNYRGRIGLGWVVLLIGLAGCAGTPDANPQLEEARAAYQAIENDAQVAESASAELKKAEDAFRRAETLWREGAKPGDVEHYAYLAKQRAAIAREVTNVAVAERSVATATAQRNQVLLGARTSEADTARQRAESRALQAERAEQQAAMAQQQAAQQSQRVGDLQKQLSELKAKQTQRGLVLTLDDVVFALNKAELKSGGRRAITRIASFLRENPDRAVLIEGFTDSLGSDEHNQQLSERRANAVRTALIQEGVTADRIRTRGYGEGFPVASNSTSAGRQLNRRVEVVISGQAGEEVAPRGS